MKSESAHQVISALREWASGDDCFLKTNARLDVVVDETFGSLHPEHRSRIRVALSSAVQRIIPSEGQSAVDWSALLNLEIRPKIPGLLVSISHTENLGGFSILPDAGGEFRGLGFDIESVPRVRPELVKRVLAKNEALHPESPALHWCAKEAAIKAISHSTGVTPLFSTLSIQWIDRAQFRCGAVYGLALSRGDLAAAVAVCR